MSNMKHLKQIGAILFLVVLIFSAVYWSVTKEKITAQESSNHLLTATINGKSITASKAIFDQEKVILELTSSKDCWVEVLKSEDYEIAKLDETGHSTELAEVSEEDWNESKLRVVTTSKKENEKVDNSLSSEAVRVTNEDNQANPVYLRLVADTPLRLMINRRSAKESTFSVADMDDNAKVQKLFNFQKNSQFLDEPIRQLIVVTDSSRQAGNLVKNEESADRLVENSLDRVSKTMPFNMDVDVSRTTGLGPFDTTNEPGYDKDADNNLVRTFDQISYRVNVGLSIADDTYQSFLIQLDTEIEGAWRIDSSGKVRQTAEISNGTMSALGGGLQKSVRKSQVKMGSSGQAYFTENVDVYGAVNQDEINTQFKVTIVSATKSNGETVLINQVVDPSVNAHLTDKVLVSAKPNVDIKLTRNKSKNSTFEKTTGTKDKPFTLITPVAAYVQLKPLSGRADLTSIKGTTYPVGGVSYEINQKITYTNTDTMKSKELEIGKEIDPVQVIAYDGLSGQDMPRRQFTNEYSSYSKIYRPLSLQATAAPYGYTGRTYPPTQPYASTIGVYNTGNPIAKNNAMTHSIEIENNDYNPISVGKNKWLFSGSQMPANSEPFSVIAMQVLFPYDYLEHQAGVNGKLDFHLSISGITYEGIKQDVSVKELVIWDRQWPGDMTSYTTFLNDRKSPLSTVAPSNNWSSNGDGSITLGNKLYGSFYNVFTDVEAETAMVFGRWNANTFAYDSSRLAETTPSNAVLSYGVSVTKTPNIKLRTQAEIEKSYAWYTSASEAELVGEITAIKSEGKVNANIVDGYANIRALVPLKIIGQVGGTDKFGYPNIGLSNSFTFKADGKQSRYNPSKEMSDYSATPYDKEGNKLGSHTPPNRWGDTLYIQSIKVRPTLTANRSTYSPADIITWTAKGSVESGAEGNHRVQLVTTIPKETQYIMDTARDHEGNSLPDPSVTVNSDGSSKLVWVLNYTAIDSHYNPTVNFDTSIISSSLEFVNNVATVNAKVVSDVWLETDESIRDTSPIAQRTSTATVTIINSGVIVIDKLVDKPLIESGNMMDPAQPSNKNPTDFTYTISYKNHSTAAMGNVRVLDVLPYNEDGRGTNYNGTYSVTEAKLLNGKGDIYYTTNILPADCDPNSVVLTSGWYKLGSDMSVLKNAKVVMASYDSIEAGKSLSLSVTLRPDGQKAGDVYANATALNSDLNKYVSGVVSKVRVLGRDISGIAWYDDKPDGLIGNLTNGQVELFVKDIPVTLYRTSHVNDSYKKELVKVSLTGEPFIDESGKSLIKTNESGKYVFKNLPEGDYIAEFQVDDAVKQKKVKVTEKSIGEDPTKNSKADSITYQTAEYSQPVLSVIYGEVTEEDPVNHVTDVNIGLTRSSNVSLFKYQGGSANDANNDGELSDTEKATGSPLKGAEFDLYEGNMKEKINSGVTDDKGLLTVGFLFPGDYTLVETKSPDGYELVKVPIHFTIAEGNITVKVYQDDAKDTVLPFTGSDSVFRLLIISAAIFLSAGLLVLIYYYYPKNSKKIKRKKKCA